MISFWTPLFSYQNWDSSEWRKLLRHYNGKGCRWPNYSGKQCHCFVMVFVRNPQGLHLSFGRWDVWVVSEVTVGTSNHGLCPPTSIFLWVTLCWRSLLYTGAGVVLTRFYPAERLQTRVVSKGKPLSSLWWLSFSHRPNTYFEGETRVFSLGRPVVE